MNGERDELTRELRRLRRAGVYFAICLAVFVALVLVGLYH